MHAVQEYSRLLKAVLVQAEKMIACLPPVYAFDRREVISFLKNYGCEGYPVGRLVDFNVGLWLARAGIPAAQHEGVVIVPCFSDDVPPVELSNATDWVLPGECFYTDQAILLYNVDHWSLAELALTLLHEGRHARHRIGPKLAHLLPLDRVDKLHETNTWLFTLNVLVAWGGAAWRAVVEREIAWLTGQRLVPKKAGQILYTASYQYWPEMDKVFGLAKYEQMKHVRQKFASLQANMEYWAQQNSSFRFEEICHTIVSHWYG